MKRLLAIVALVLMSSSASFALTDAEYLRMKKSNADFARADKRLSQVWAQLKKSLPKNVFADLQKEQREWIASVRDDEAAQLMSEGYSRLEAYTIATNDRADELPRIAKELSNSRARTTQPQTKSNAATKPATKTTPKPAAISEPEPYVPEEPDESEMESQPLNEPAGEYTGRNCFMTVKVLDYSSMEAEVTFGRWKDDVSWSASGWIDDDVLELSDSRYSTCQATIVFEGNSARVSLTDSGDWAKATADDFDMAGTYTKNM